LNKEDKYRYKEKILPSHFNVKRKKNTKLIWFHAASLGELKSIIPIIKELDNNNKNLEFLITTVTLSSSNLANSEFKNFQNIYHRFLPIDVLFLIKKFLNEWSPHAIFFVDSEIWPNLLFQAKKKNILISLINARITSRTFNRWKKIPRTSKKIFSLFNLCLTSNTETKDFLEKLGATNIHYKGNIKLINQIDEEKIKDPNHEILSKKRFWFAASIHENEDIYCLKTHINLKKKYQDILTIIAPRHVDRVNKIKDLSKKYNLNAQILDKGDLIIEGKEILIINSFGVLNNYYKYAKSVFIGKSTLKKFDKNGGQNPIEAASLGCKIYHGPYVYNFKEIYKFLERNLISKKIENYDELSNNLTNDLKIFKKEKNKVSNLMNYYSQKTLTNTMEKVNYFLFNAI
tara:strand:+ start:1973 stop:3178 length:1206 start_codon:yes stop_codon:yes gene_type:complete